MDIKTEKSVLYSNHHTTSSNMPTIGHSSSSTAKDIHVDGYVGFANLPNQVYRKAVKRGFEFTLMVVGKHYIMLDFVSAVDAVAVCEFMPVIQEQTQVLGNYICVV